MSRQNIFVFRLNHISKTNFSFILFAVHVCICFNYVHLSTSFWSLPSKSVDSLMEKIYIKSLIQRYYRFLFPFYSYSFDCTQRKSIANRNFYNSSIYVIYISHSFRLNTAKNRIWWYNDCLNGRHAKSKIILQEKNWSKWNHNHNYIGIIWFNKLIN